MWFSLLGASCLPTYRYGGTPQTLLTPIPSFPPCLPFRTPYPNPYTHTDTAQFLPLKIFQSDKQIPITHPHPSPSVAAFFLGRSDIFPPSIPGLLLGVLGSFDLLQELPGVSIMTFHVRYDVIWYDVRYMANFFSWIISRLILPSLLLVLCNSIVQIPFTS